MSDLKIRGFSMHFFALLFIIFNVALPKGGFAIGSIPITWGYLLLIPLFLFSLLNTIKDKTIFKPRIFFWSVMPFGLYFLVYLYQAEILTPTGFVLSSILNLVVLPIFFSSLFRNGASWVFKHIGYIHDIILKCILFISIYGILLFLYKIYSGIDIEIPYLTTNIKDYGNMNDKYNDRGDGIFKLISTYNNGNILGVCILFLLPFTTNYKIHNYLLKIVMVLTLSRTAWVGLFIYDFFVHRKNLKKLALVIGLNLILCLGCLTIIMNKDASYIFDPTLNGRIKIGNTGNVEDPLSINGDQHEEKNLSLQSSNDATTDKDHEIKSDKGLNHQKKSNNRFYRVSPLSKISFFYKDFYQSISEMTYRDILNQMGVFGFLLFLLQVFSWLLPISKVNNEKTKSYQEKLKIGLLSYLIISFIDGAYLLIPVGLLFWITYALVTYSQTDEKLLFSSEK